MTLIVDFSKQDRSTILGRDEKAFEHQEQLSRLGVGLCIDRVLVEAVSGKARFDFGCSSRVHAPAQRVEARLVICFALEAWWNADEVNSA